MKLRSLIFPLAAAAALMLSASAVAAPAPQATAQVCLRDFDGSCHQVVRGDPYTQGRPDAYAWRFLVRATVSCPAPDPALAQQHWPVDSAGPADRFMVTFKAPRGTKTTDTTRTVCGWVYDGTADDGQDIYRPVTAQTVQFVATLKPWAITSLRAPWLLSMGGRTVARGLLSIRRTTSIPGSSQRIWDTSFDEYWNTCVNGGKQVWASGGHLYCVDSYPASRSFSYHLL